MGFNINGISIAKPSTDLVFTNNSNTLTMDANGYISNPTQPISYSAGSHSTPAAGHLAWPNNYYNVGTIYSYASSDGRWTAPVSGYYMFAGAGNTFNNGGTDYIIWYKNDGTFICGWYNNSNNSTTWKQWSNAFITYLTSGQYVYGLNNTGGAIQMDGNYWTNMSCTLIG